MTEKSRKKVAETEEQPEDGQPETDELSVAKAKADEYLSMAMRLQADFDNYRKRAQKDNEEFRKYANEGMAKDLLNIVDDVDRALDNTEEDTEFVRGIRGIRQNLMKILEANGMAEIRVEGKFDPNLHEALCVVESDVDDDIAEVLQKGYRMHDRVIRYPKVKVTKKKE